MSYENKKPETNYQKNQAQDSYQGKSEVPYLKSPMIGNYGTKAGYNPAMLGSNDYSSLSITHSPDGSITYTITMPSTALNGLYASMLNNSPASNYLSANKTDLSEYKSRNEPKKASMPSAKKTIDDLAA